MKSALFRIFLSHRNNKYPLLLSLLLLLVVVVVSITMSVSEGGSHPSSPKPCRYVLSSSILSSAKEATLYTRLLI
jgi:hypothetical protein